MPVRKRVYKKKKVVRRPKKSSYAIAKRINTKNDVYYFERLSAKPNLTGSNVPIFGSWIFQLSDLPNVTEFTNLFDQYMIMKVQLKMKLQFDPGAFTPATAFFPEIYLANDYDDNVVPSSTDELRQRQKCKQVIIKPNVWTTHYIKPAVQNVVYNPNNSSSVGYGNKWNQWIDVADPTVSHYGIKYAIETLGTNQSLKIDCRYYVAFRGVR